MWIQSYSIDKIYGYRTCSEYSTSLAREAHALIGGSIGENNLAAELEQRFCK